MNKEKEEKLIQLFEDWCGNKNLDFNQILGSGSNRQYYRMYDGKKAAIGVIGMDDKENEAFLEFSSHFKKHDLNVPDIYSSDIKKGIYLQQDLGDNSLFEIMQKEGQLTENIEQLYIASIEELIKFQVVAGKDLDFSYCFPRINFDKQSMHWDLNYFKYYSLKFQDIQFDEENLENDFRNIIEYLSQADSDYFMYRDFQTRNIMILDNKPFFIDYQGGRKGPLQYDLASLLFQAKADLPADFRKKMLDHYMKTLGEHMKFDKEKFIEFYYGFVLLRTLQVLGAYGFRGYYEKKPHFMESLAYAIKNVDWLIENIDFKFEFPELRKSLQQLSEKFKANNVIKSSSSLTVEINSFSYLYSGIPKDISSHGGGFVFDCRSLPNPGRYAEYKKLSGLDQPVIDFLKKEPEVDNFFLNVTEIVERAIDNYIERDFDHLMINFGCTGGQHRSVYCAERLYKKLLQKYDINIELQHLMKEKWS